MLFLFANNSDIYFTISSGRDILNGHWYTNTHTNLPIIVQQWLYAVICAEFDKLGLLGIYLLTFIQDVLLIYVTYIFIYNRTKNRWKSIVIPMIALIISFQYMICVRPQIITMILLIIELIILDKFTKTKNILYLFWLIPLSILSANMHQAVFLYHIYIIIPYLIIFTRPKNKIKINWKLLIFIPIMILCTLCTPYKLDGALYTYHSFKSKVFDNVNISEINPTSILSYFGIVIVLCVIYTMYLLYKGKSNKYINYYTITTMILLFMSLRHFSIIYICLIFILMTFSMQINISKLSFLCSMYIVIFLLVASIIQIPKLDIIKLRKAFNNLDIPKTATIYNMINAGGFLEYYGYNVLSDARPELYTEEFCGKDIISNQSIFYTGYDTKNKKWMSNTEIENIYKDYDYVIVSSIAYVNKVLESDSNYEKYKEIEDTYIIWKKANN